MPAASTAPRSIRSRYVRLTGGTGNRRGALSTRASGRLDFRSVGQVQPRLDDRIGIERQAVDALVDEPAREIRVVGRALAADADVPAGIPAGLDRHRQQRLDRRVTLVEERGDDRRV